MDNVELIYETYHLPEIKREGLTEVEYNHRCKYLRLYIRLIEKCQSMTETELLGYNFTEKHHILPESLGGTRESQNIVEMPVRYHVMAHVVLKEAYPDNYKIVFSAFMILYGRKVKGKDGSIENIRKKVREQTISLRTVTRIREEFIQRTKTDKEFLEKKSGENCFWYGKHLSDDIKEKISRANKGRVRSDETKEKLRQANLGKRNSPDARKKMGKKGKLNPLFGKHLSEETKKKLSEARSKRKVWGKRRIMAPDGTIYDSVKEAVQKTDTPFKTIRNMTKGSQPNPGWRYLDGEA